VSAVLAPFSLVGSWLAAGFVQNGNHNAIQQPISVERSARLIDDDCAWRCPRSSTASRRADA
jgi:hypothetical protein